MIIYKATNKVNNKCYIGQTINALSYRRMHHYKDANSGRYSVYFHHAIRKYGKDNFIWEVLENCNSKEELDEMEFHYIKQYNSFKPSGYNMTLGGDGGRDAGTLGAKASWDKTRSNYAWISSRRSEGQIKRFADKKERERYKTISLVPKCYLIVTPDNKELIVENLAKFARDNYLEVGYISSNGFKSCLRKVNKGIMVTAKGFWCKLIQ